ncbi:Islet cell autoantigen 1 [Sarcoptes scabiei]|uniref:Islet cell autoantigen 1 n=1 Tax=Sarcoptes scabiei TaxID=52283 RepID=A0A834RA26_SARSC|nr:Islet cell autoantigen 1 [Sarcoptes scabiei]
MDESTITKMQCHYWEAKQTFLKKIKRKEDDFIVASDAELDAKLELLKSIDETNQNLLNLLEHYQERICSLSQEQCILGKFLRECGKHDTTNAGNLMANAGKTFLFAGHQFFLLRSILLRSFRDVQTFQYRAVTDTFETVEQMEKSRTAYRAALLWMKDISKQLDPEACIQVDKFKKIQNHVRDKKSVFDKLKIDSLQKIDLLSASRCNLFNNILLLYQNILKDVWSKTTKTMNIFTETYSTHLGYEFQMLKELNTDSKFDEISQSFEEKLKELIAQQSNTNNCESSNNDLDMLIFFEADYTDEAKEGSQLKENKNPLKNLKDKPSRKSSTFSRKRNESQAKLLDLDLTDSNLNEKVPTEISNSTSNSNRDELSRINLYLPSFLIDFDQNKQFSQTASTEHNKSFDGNIFSDFDFFSFGTSKSDQNKSQDKIVDPERHDHKSKNSSSSNDKKNNWLDIFTDIDPLTNPEEFDRKFFLPKSNDIDRKC